MGEEDISPPQDGKDEKESPGDHEKNQNGEGQAEDKWKGGMDISQSHQRYIPDQKDEKEKDQTGYDQQPDKNSLLGFNLQSPSKIT
jgi:hypothetical protein